MKTKLRTLFIILNLFTFIGLATAQVVLNPNHIEGTLSFTNTNPDILSILGSPGDFGIYSGEVFADSLPPATNLLEIVTFNNMVGGLTGFYDVTVESSPSGIAYIVSPEVSPNNGNDLYQFTPLESQPAVSAAAPVTLDFGECVTLLDIVFVNASDVPVMANAGSITAAIPGYGIQAQSDLAANTFSPAATNRYLAVRGGTNYTLSVQYDIGTNVYGDQVQFELVTNISAIADQIMTIKCVVPDAASAGEITGKLGMAGEFLLSIPGTPPTYPARPVLIAGNGPFGNQRWNTVPGTNFTVSASGAFALTNLPASTAVSPPQGYSVHAEMQFRTNYQFTWFRSPGLGEGANPPVIVTAGGATNLGNTFNITPGYFDGTILLLGPVENGTTESLLRGVRRSIDPGPSPDGIPGAVDIYENYYSGVQAFGLDEAAPGASLTAVNGQSDASFPGAYDPAISGFSGSYEVVVGGLNSQNSLWNDNELDLTLYGGAATNPATYYDENLLAIYDQRTNSTSINVAAGQHYTNNIAYCFSEVDITFNTTAGTFFNPEIFEGNGEYTNTDFQGNTANYTVFVEEATGTPVDAASATNTGLVRLELPEGSYTLTPTVYSVAPDGGQNYTELAPITVNVGCQQVISLSECLQINVNLPAFTSSRILPVVGTVTSCNNVTNITYQLNGGAIISACTGCGVNPGFTFDLDLAAAGECATNTVTITAYDDSGAVSSVTSQIQFNDNPPTINCPNDIVISCAETNLAPVTFDVTAFSSCSAPVNIVCHPPSGSLFPAGTNTVTCYAVDVYGNQSAQCSFNVVVESQMISIQRAVMVTWGCGMLQSAPTLSGPWTDVPGATSPYCAVISQSELFYRTRP